MTFSWKKLENFWKKKHPSKSTRTEKTFLDWLTPDLKNQMNERDKKRDLAKLTGNKTHWQEYRRERNACTKNLKTTKNEHYKNLFKSYDKNNDTRSIYSTAKKLLSLKKGSSPQSFLVEGRLIRRPVDLAIGVGGYPYSMVVTPGSGTFSKSPLSSS